jgi:hypothetical protein
MNQKQLTILVLLGLILGGAGLYVRNRQQQDYQASSRKMGEKILGDFEVNSVVGLRVTQGTNVIDVVKKDNDWVVKQRADYPANFDSIRDFVRKLADLKVTQPVKAGPSRLPVLELSKETGTQVELFDAGGKVIRTVMLGRKHMREGNDNSPFGGGGFPDGRYVMLGTDPSTIALVSEALSNADTKPSDWLSKDFFKVEKPKSVKVTFPVATNSFAIVRDNEFGEWRLADATGDEKLDTGKAGGFSSVLSYASFNDVVLDRKPEELGLDKPTVAEIGTTEGFTYIINAGKAEGENYAMTVQVKADLKKEREPGKDEKPEDKEKLDKEFKEKLGKLEEKLKSEQALGKWIYQVNKYTLDQLLKERHSLLAEKKTDQPKTDPNAGESPGPVTLPPTDPVPLPVLPDPAKEPK